MRSLKRHDRLEPRRLDGLLPVLVIIVLIAGGFRCSSSGQTSGHSAEKPPTDAGGTSNEQVTSSHVEPLDLTGQVIRDVLATWQAGVQSHNVEQVLSVFDAEATQDYPHLRDEFRSFFARYNDVRFRYKILQLTSEKDRGFVTAEVDLDANPLDENLMELRRSTQMRLQLARTSKGWKVAAISPGNFFEQ